MMMAFHTSRKRLPWLLAASAVMVTIGVAALLS
jgi:hypothetical protein